LIDAKQEDEQQRVTRVAIMRGAMFQSTEERQQRSYTIRNRDTSPRTIVIEHPVRAGWKLADGEEPAESTASYHRFRVTLEPKKTTKLVVKEYHPLSNRYELSNMTDDQIAYFLTQKTINPQVEQALRRVASAKNNIAALDAQIAARKGQMSSITEDQQRVRENMKALKGSAQERALVERYARELNEQEDRVQALQREMSDLRQTREAAQKTLNEIIEGMTLEARL
jgi:archaellum component FlaC